jgi:hypothetical protein
VLVFEREESQAKLADALISARQSDAATAAAVAGLVPAGASMDLRRDGGYVVARVSSRSPILPGVVIVGEAVSLTEAGR